MNASFSIMAIILRLLARIATASYFGWTLYPLIVTDISPEGEQSIAGSCTLSDNGPSIWWMTVKSYETPCDHSVHRVQTHMHL